MHWHLSELILFHALLPFKPQTRKICATRNNPPFRNACSVYTFLKRPSDLSWINEWRLQFQVVMRSIIQGIVSVLFHHGPLVPPLRIHHHLFDHQSRLRNTHMDLKMEGAPNYVVCQLTCCQQARTNSSLPTQEHVPALCRNQELSSGHKRPKVGSAPPS